MQCFSENFRKKKLIFDILIPFDKIFPGNIQLFQNSYLEVPKFNEKS